MVKLRTFLTLLVGVLVGLIFSPASILFQFQELEFSARQVSPLCTHTKNSLNNPTIVPQKNLSVPPTHSPKMTSRVSPPDFPHNPCKLTAEGNFTPTHNPSIRYKKLMSELSPRKLVYIGVISSAKYLATRAVGIYNTWGKEAIPHLHFYSAPPEDAGLSYLPVITLPDVNDTQYPPQRKVYRTLKYMAEHFIDQYDFFIRSDDDVYYRMDKMMRLLEGINPAQDIYMGCPGFGKDDDKERLKLEKHEHYCMGGPGVIFSRSALRKLTPHLETCLETVVVSWNEDVEIGRCVSKMLQLQCTWAWETRLLFWTDYKKIMPTEELYTEEVVKGTVSLHPIKQQQLMYRVHQYMQELRLQAMLQDAQNIQDDIQDTTGLLVREMSHYRTNRWLWYDLDSNPESRSKISVWGYFNSTRLFPAHDPTPNVPLPPSLASGRDKALEVAIRLMSAKEEWHGQVKPEVVDGYSLTDSSSGSLYSMHVSLRQGSPEKEMEFAVDVFLPFQGVGMAVYKDAASLLSQVVHVIVGVARTHDITDFLHHYTTVCLKSKVKVHLHVVLFSSNPGAKESLELAQQIYPNSISTYELKDSSFSYSHAYNLVSKTLDDNDLMVFFDISFHFTGEFLDHCRTIARQGSQAYFPTAFSYYKPELVEQFTQLQPQSSISSDSGFFMLNNFQVAALYQSDYLAVSGHVTSSEGIHFVDKVLESDIHVFRGLDPYLRRNYKPQSCNGLSGNPYFVCMTTKVDALASKKVLGSLVTSNNLLD